MVFGAKRLGILINKFERLGEEDDELEGEPLRPQRKRLTPISKKKPATEEGLQIGDKIGEPSRPQRKRLTPRSKKKPATVEGLQIGDKIYLLDSPWKDCHSVPCRAVRRPAFAESAMVAFAGASGALAVSQSSKQFIMIVDRHIVEFTKLSESTGRVAFVSSVDELYKMTLRQQEVIALFFKSVPDDPMIYNCRESNVVSQLIRASKGSGMVRREAIHKALHLIQEIQAQERALVHKPSRERVNEITTLYDTAAQQFIIAEDARHKEVVEHKMRFLALPLVKNILNGTFQEPTAQLKREPEILEGSSKEYDGNGIYAMDSDEISAISYSWEALEKREDTAFNASVDDILFEARQDFEHLTVSEGNHDFFALDGIADGETSGVILDGATDGDFLFADLDAMINAAGKKLEEILRM